MIFGGMCGGPGLSVLVFQRGKLSCYSLTVKQDKSLYARRLATKHSNKPI